MTFTVEWLPDAEAELAGAWLAAPDRAAVTRAAHALEKDLRTRPESLGESRPDGRRLAFVPPLGVIFRVRPRDRRVRLLHVWRYETRR